MKNTASNTSRHAFNRLSYLVTLGKTLEGAYGAGVMTADYKREAPKAGWTAQQLMAMSVAKSLYN